MLKPDRELYREEYRGINIEVSRQWNKYDEDRNPDGVWCFYLHLLVEQFPVELHPDLTRPKKTLDYGTTLQPYAECLEGLDWHSGMTFYEVSKFAEPFRTIKAGCDFNHLWDEGQRYSADGVMSEARRCVDSLFVAHPHLRSTKELWEEYRKPFHEAMLAKEKAKSALTDGKEGGG